MYVFMQCFFVPFRVKAIYLSEKGNVDLLSYIFIYIFCCCAWAPRGGGTMGERGSWGDSQLAGGIIIPEIKISALIIIIHLPSFYTG